MIALTVCFLRRDAQKVAAELRLLLDRIESGDSFADANDFGNDLDGNFARYCYTDTARPPWPDVREEDLPF